MALLELRDQELSPRDLEADLRAALGERYAVAMSPGGFLLPREAVLVTRSPWIGVTVQPVRDGRDRRTWARLGTAVPGRGPRIALALAFIPVPIGAALALGLQIRARGLLEEVGRALLERRG